MPQAFNFSSRSRKNPPTSRTTFCVTRILLHGLRRALHVHANVTGANLGDHFPHCVVAAVRRHVVDDAGAGGERGARNGGFHRVNRKRNFRLGRKFFDDWKNAAQFFGFIHRFRAGPRGFAADVQNLRALRDQFQRVGDGFSRIKKFSAVGKGIRRDVDDAHDERRAREAKFKLSRAEIHPPFMENSFGFVEVKVLLLHERSAPNHLLPVEEAALQKVLRFQIDQGRVRFLFELIVLCLSMLQ